MGIRLVGLKRLITVSHSLFIDRSSILNFPQVIPKKLHYCWFGGKPLPADTLRYIETWRRHCPDYEIKEWNESNFDLDLYPYVREAYDAGKYAFVSDVARLYALATEGGVYLDTDVEIVQSLDRFLGHTAFTGFEDEHHVTTGIMGAEKGARYACGNLEAYATRHFVRPDGTYDTTTNVAVITEYMSRHGLNYDNTLQDFPGLVTIYPREYFCPKDSYAYSRNQGCITTNTHAIHYFAGTWQIRNTPEYIRLRRKYRIIPYFIRKKLILALLGESKRGFFPTLLRIFGKKPFSFFQYRV